MFISQQLTVFIYDVLSILLLTAITSIFLIIEGSRSSYHSQKLSDVSRLTLALKLPKLVKSKQIDKVSWVLLVAFLGLATLTSFITTILNSRTVYSTQFIGGPYSVYEVNSSDLATNFNLGQQCSMATGELMDVECLYENLSDLLYLNSDNSSNTIGIIGNQYENITGTYTFSEDALQSTDPSGQATTGITTSAGNILLPGLAGLSRFAWSGSIYNISNNSATTFEFVMNGTSPFLTDFRISDDMFMSMNTPVGDPFTNITASSISQLGFYNPPPDGTTYQNMTYQTLEYFYGNKTDVTMIMTTTHTYFGPLNNIPMATKEITPLNSFSGLASSLSLTAANTLVQALNDWNGSSTGYVMAVTTDTTHNNSVCYEIIYAANITAGPLGMVHSKNCWTILAANMSTNGNQPAYVGMRPVINTRFGSAGYSLEYLNCIYGAGPGPQYYNFRDSRLQNVLLNMASQAQRGNIAIPIISGASITGNYQGTATVIALIIVGLIALALWLIGRTKYRSYAAPLIDVLLNTASTPASGENFHNKLSLDAKYLYLDNEPITTLRTAELASYDSRTDLKD